MSGYRTSSYDPTAYEGAGPPLRPYNKVQWLGIALQFAAAVAYGYYFAAQAGWARNPGFDTMLVGLPLLIAGMNLTYSRRAGQTDLAPELAAARKRWMIVTVAACSFILGIAAILALKGY